LNEKVAYPGRRGGFTLVEMVLAMTVLALIVLVVSQMLNKAQSVIILSRKQLDVDDQARLAFARMANDFGKIVKRYDCDTIFAKQAYNDKIFFYSQSVGDTSNGTFANGSTENPVSLIGYTVATDPNTTTNPPYDLQRLGRGLNWLASSSASATDNMVFLTANPTSTTYFDPASTLDGHWNTQSLIYCGTGSVNSIGTAPTYAPTAPLDPDYHVLGDQIFRFEYCFLLKDGTYSDYPAEANANNVPSGAVPLILVSKPPSVNDDGSNTASDGTVAIGTRWVDQNAGRAYICTSAITKSATWQALGVRDVAAVVVAIALLDRNSRNLIFSLGGSVSGLPNIFPDSGLTPTGTGTGIANIPASGVTLMLQNWNSLIAGSSFVGTVASKTGIPAGAATGVASHISVYQRYFYLNSASSL
jgi:prepilin-type N-terminal cleavage/methylation domain-containing protein